jgi:hypothetical protein
MKYYRISMFLIVNLVIFSLLWISVDSDPIMSNNSVVEADSHKLSLDPISFSVSSPSTRTTTEATILPKTNMTVSQYISGQGKVNTLDLYLLSLNTSHWFTRADYQNTSSIDSPFESVISRDSNNHFYNSSNYCDWDENPSVKFDFWIDPTNFANNYRFLVYIPFLGGNKNITVLGLENITMNGVGTFEAWKISIDLPGFPNFSYYEKDTGMFLSSYLYFAPSAIWFNLTSLEKVFLPNGYIGPMPTSTSPSNESLLASGSLISVELTSPYGLAAVYYNWDGQTNLTSSRYIETSIPGSGGLHNLTIIAYDNVGYYTSFFLVYETDVSLAGVILNSPRNNSRIQGESQIELTVVSGNGTMLINWDNGEDNESIPIIGDEVILEIPNKTLEISHILSIFVNNSDDVWTRAKYLFFVDNTLPTFTLYDFENNSVQKGEVKITLSVSEDANVTYSLNGEMNSSFIIEKYQNHSLLFNTLSNGTYFLHLEIKDEAGNINFFELSFSIHTSDFNWNWSLNAEETRNLKFYDENNTLWFTCSIVSSSNQFFNLSFLSGGSSPSLPSDNLFGIELLCEIPSDIIFLTLIYPLSEQLIDIDDTFTQYEWVVWFDQEWAATITSYDQVSHAWKTTSLGYSQYFALIDCGKTTQLRSVVIGGGSIPAFELPTILLSICLVVVIKKVKKNVNKKN